MKKIWIDAGHGGSDAGAVNGTRYEKTDNLNFALKLAELLCKNGVEITLTRRGDVSMSAAERIVLEKGCDLAVSCHRNAGASTASGVEIWLHSHAPAHYVNWASDIIARLEKLGAKIRPGTVAKGVYKGYPGYPNSNFWVNRDTNSPSMLLELGFISNEIDNSFFDKNIDKMAFEVAAACLTMLGLEMKAPEETKDKYTELLAKHESLIRKLKNLTEEFK